MRIFGPGLPKKSLNGMLKTENLSFAYPGQEVMGFPDMFCDSGAHWLLLGQSGSGKTTLLHLMAGLLTPRSGKVIIEDTDLTRLGSRARDRFRGRHIGLIFQQPHFVRALTVAENLLLAQRLAGQAADRGRILGLLDHLGIAGKAHKKPNQLSVGEQQRAAIARALVNRPTVLFADEPTSALDDANCEAVIALVKQEARAVGATLLVVTHDQRLKNSFSDQLILHAPPPVGLGQVPSS